MALQAFAINILKPTAEPLKLNFAMSVDDSVASNPNFGGAVTTRVHQLAVQELDAAGLIGFRIVQTVTYAYIPVEHAGPLDDVIDWIVGLYDEAGVDRPGATVAPPGGFEDEEPVQPGEPPVVIPPETGEPNPGDETGGGTVPAPTPARINLFGNPLILWLILER